jgi:AcrR family transcriptional regulator
LLVEKSFEAITVQDIAQRATVNRATFYAHFQDKYVLLDELTREWIAKSLRAKLPADAEYNIGNLKILVQTVCEFLEQLRTHCAPSNRSQFDSLVELQVKRQVYATLLRWLEENGSSAARYREQAELNATMTSWAIYGAAKRWSEGERKQSAGDFAQRTLPSIIAGLEAQTPQPNKARTNHVNLIS